MIPKEKIKQSARIYSTSKNRGFEGAEYIVRSIASEYDFKAGVEFAEAELSKPFTSSNTRQNLFNYFAEQHVVYLMDSDFNEIGNYMKPELKNIAIEFAEWINANKWKSGGISNKWEYTHYIGTHSNAYNCIKTITSSTAELFDKFMAERSAK